MSPVATPQTARSISSGAESFSGAESVNDKVSARLDSHKASSKLICGAPSSSHRPDSASSIASIRGLEELAGSQSTPFKMDADNAAAAVALKQHVSSGLLTSSSSSFDGAPGACSGSGASSSMSVQHGRKDGATSATFAKQQQHEAAQVQLPSPLTKPLVSGDSFASHSDSNSSNCSSSSGANTPAAYKVERLPAGTAGAGRRKAPTPHRRSSTPGRMASAPSLSPFAPYASIPLHQPLSLPVISRVSVSAHSSPHAGGGGAATSRPHSYAGHGPASALRKHDGSKRADLTPAPLFHRPAVPALSSVSKKQPSKVVAADAEQQPRRRVGPLDRVLQSLFGCGHVAHEPRM